jgi:hypothetical protein
MVHPAVKRRGADAYVPRVTNERLQEILPSASLNKVLKKAWLARIQ